MRKLPVKGDWFISMYIASALLSGVKTGMGSDGGNALWSTMMAQMGWAY